MDIAGLSSALSSSSLQQQASVAVLKKTMSLQKQQGEAALALLASAAETARSAGIGGASPPGVGTRLDVRA